MSVANSKSRSRIIVGRIRFKEVLMMRMCGGLSQRRLVRASTGSSWEMAFSESPRAPKNTLILLA